MTYGQRPSAIIGIADDDRLAYDFDLSVTLIATSDKPAKDDPSQYADINAAFAAKRGR